MFELYADDVVDIREYFKELKDPRSTINQKHLLGDLIVICVLAVIAGADGPNAIGIWANSHRDWLIRHLPLPGGIPSHDTIGRLLAALLTTETTFYHSIWSVPGRCSLESVLGNWRRMQSRTKSQRFQH